MAVLLGMNAKAYILGATNIRVAWTGSGQAGLTEMSNVKDLSVDLTKDVTDTTTRGNNGWKSEAATLRSGAVKFGMLWDPTDTSFTQLATAFMGTATVACAFLDGPRSTVGSQGLWSDFHVASFAKSENLGDAQMVEVELKPTLISATSAATAWITTS